MPGTAVDIGIGQGSCQSTMHLTPASGRGITVDRGSHERVPEFDTGIVHGDECRRLGGNQVGEVKPEGRRGAGEYR